MRILQLTHHVRPNGGLEAFVQRLSVDLVANDHETLIVSADGAPPDFTVPVRSESDLFAADHARREAAEQRIVDLARELKPHAILSHVPEHHGVLRRLALTTPTVIISHTYACTGAKLFRRGERLCEHSIGIRCLRDWYLGPCGPTPNPVVAATALAAARQRIKTMQAVTAVVVGSQHMRQYLIGEGVAPQNVHVADLAVGISAEQPARDAGKTFIEVLFVGRLCITKGVHHAVRMVAANPRFRLSVVGDGWFRGRLEKEISRLTVTDRVRLYGALHGDALDDCWRAADVVVVPSLWPEPVGLVVPEAQARGVPVVVYDSGGLHEWAERLPGVTTVPRGDLGALTRETERAATATCSGGDAVRLRQPPPSVRDVLEQLVN